MGTRGEYIYIFFRKEKRIFFLRICYYLKFVNHIVNSLNFSFMREFSIKLLFVLFFKLVQ